MSAETDFDNWLDDLDDLDDTEREEFVNALWDNIAMQLEFLACCAVINTAAEEDDVDDH